MRNNYLKSENYYFLITHFDATRSGGDGGEQQKKPVYVHKPVK